MLQAQIPIPGFRAFTSVTWGGSSLVVGFAAGDQASCWAIPDPLNTGTYVALQFRAWRADSDRPWWLADRNWWDKALDSPYYPGNWGGGYAWTSMPDDLVIVGDVGYNSSLPVDEGGYPSAFLHCIKVLASFYTMRPASILADVAITPSGAVETVIHDPSGETVNHPTNVTWGGQDLRDLYIGSIRTDYVLKARSPVAGQPQIHQR